MQDYSADFWISTCSMSLWDNPETHHFHDRRIVERADDSHNQLFFLFDTRILQMFRAKTMCGQSYCWSSDLWKSTILKLLETWNGHLGIVNLECGINIYPETWSGNVVMWAPYLFKNKNMTCKFGKMGSTSIQKIWNDNLVIWDKYLHENMKWTLGNMEPISIKNIGNSVIPIKGI